MSNSEDYLDQLLKGVSEEDEMFDTGLLEEELLGDDGIDDLMSDDFLKEFEMEMARLEEGDEEEPTFEEQGDGIEALFDDLDMILNGSSEDMPVEEIPEDTIADMAMDADAATDVNTATDSGMDFGFGSLFDEEPLPDEEPFAEDSFTEDIQEEMFAEGLEAITEEQAPAEEVSEEEDDVMKIMADLGDIDLELDQVEAEMGITSEPMGGMSDDALLSMLAADSMSMDETGNTDIDSFAFEELEEAPAEGKKNKKEKKTVDPNSFLGKMSLLLFGEDEEEEEEPPKEKKKKEKKEKPEKPKKEKKEKPKKEKKPPKPKKEKKPKPPKEPDKTPPLPKKPVFLIFLMVASLVALIILGTDLFGYSNQFKEAKNAYAKKNYSEAFSYVSGLEVKDKDYDTYKKYHTMALVAAPFEAYESLMAEEFYDMALDCLVRTVGRYEKYKEDAEIYGCIEELNALELKAETILSETFGVTKEEALEFYGYRDRRDYSTCIQNVIRELGLVRMTEE